MAPAVQLPDTQSNTQGRGSIRHDCQDLVLLFERCFTAEFNTQLVSGGAEPEYLPHGEEASRAQIIFTRDYFASALHETAHWCLAGPDRRRLRDYGYWYSPDGRSAEQQAEFERVEVKPQALEWIFAEAAAFRFRVSADNLNQGVGASMSFKCDIATQAQKYVAEGLPRRAQRFADALAAFYGAALDERRFSLSHL